MLIPRSSSLHVSGLSWGQEEYNVSSGFLTLGWPKLRSQHSSTGSPDDSCSKSSSPVVELRSGNNSLSMSVSLKSTLKPLPSSSCASQSPVRLTARQATPKINLRGTKPIVLRFKTACQPVLVGRDASSAEFVGRLVGRCSSVAVSWQLRPPSPPPRPHSHYGKALMSPPPPTRSPFFGRQLVSLPKKVNVWDWGKF